MKKRNSVILLLSLMMTAFNLDATNITRFENEAENTSFYKVPLVCNAAPSIGCGSRSKPILLELEKSALVKEAWLNRQGNVIALVWSENVTLEDRKNMVTSTFSRHNVNASELMLDDYATNYESFSSNMGWYRGDDVNSLSKEEAGIIADQLLVGIKDKTNLKASDEKALQEEIQNVFYDFFLNYKSLDQLSDAKVYKGILREVIKLGEKYVGKGNMPNTKELWQICSGGTTHTDDCCKSGSSCSAPKKS